MPLPIALAYLEARTGSSAYAELLLRKGLASGLIRYRELETEVHFPDRGKPPVPGRVFTPLPLLNGAEFWRVAPFDDSSQLEIDRRRSEAIRVDYAVQLLDGTWYEHRIMYKRGLRVLEDDLKEMLQLEGPLPPADVPADQLPTTISVPDPPPPPPPSSPASEPPPPPPAPPPSTLPADQPPTMSASEPPDVSAASVAATPAPLKLPRGKVERWVYEQLKTNPPVKGDHELVVNLHERCPYEVAKKTIANLVGRYRKQFELPAGSRESSRGK